MKIPVVIWNDESPSHRITCLCVCKSGIIVTGSIEGQLVFWIQNFTDDEFAIVPKNVIIAHSSCVESLVDVRNQKLDIYSAVISLAANQEICLWNSETCCCLTSTFLQGRFHSLHVLPCKSPTSLKESLLACFGYQNVIHILDPFTFEIIFILQPEILKCCVSTICSLTFASNPKFENYERLFGITHDGSLITWLLPCSNSAQKDSKGFKIIGKFLNEIKDINKFNIRNIYVQPITSDFILACSINRFFIFKLPSYDLVFEHSFEDKIIQGALFISQLSFVLHFENSVIYFILDENLNLISSVNICSETENLNLECIALLRTNPSMLIGASFSGNLYVWKINECAPCELHYNVSLEDAWKCACPNGISKYVTKPLSDNFAGISSSLQLHEYGFMIFGLKNGLIIASGTIELLLNQTFGEGTLDQVASLVLKGHTGAVTCLCYPFGECNKHNPCHLLSGSVDFTVRLWNLVEGTQLKMYTPHGGFIHDIFVLVDNSLNDLKIVSVASDYSVALINIAFEKEIISVRAQTSPIYSVRLLTKEDLLLVFCTDGSLFIWEVSSGNLERCVSGSRAIDIFQAWNDDPEQSSSQPCMIVNLDQQERQKHNHRSFLQDIKTKRGFVFSHKHNAHVLSSKKKVLQKFSKIKHTRSRISKNKSIDQSENPQYVPPATGVVSHYSSACNLARLSSGNSNEEDMSNHTNPLLPFTVIPIRTGHHDSDFHVAIFDIEFLLSFLMSKDQREHLTQHKTSIWGPRQHLNIDSSVSSNRIVHSLMDIKDNLPLMTLALGLSPLNDGRSYKKYIDFVQNYRAYAFLNAAKLLLGCLHPWGVDQELDKLLKSFLSMSESVQPVTFGFMCRHKLQLTLPTSFCEKISTSILEHWKVSSVVSAQHLVTLLSLTNVLMNIHKPDGGHSISSKIVDSEGRQFVTKSVPDLSFQPQSFEILRVWSKLLNQHSSLVDKFIKHDSPFKCPAIHELICYWLDLSPIIRDASYSILIRQLKNLSPSFRQSLVRSWSLYLPSPEEVDTIPIEDLLILPTEDYVESGGFFGFWPSDRRYLGTLSVFLVSFVISEFSSEFDPLNTKDKNSTNTGLSISFIIVLATIMLKSLRSSINFKTNYHYRIRQPFLFFLSRDFSLWQPHLNISLILSSLLESSASLDLHLMHQFSTSRQDIYETPYGQLLLNYRHCLKQIMLNKPEVVVTVLNKDFARHSSTTPHFGAGQSALVAAVAYTSMRHNYNLFSSHPNVLHLARKEVVSLIETMAINYPQRLISLSLESIDLLISCSAHKLSKKDQNIFASFPFLNDFGIFDCCDITRRFVVGTIRGQFAIFDLRTLRSSTLNCFSQPVTCLKFSPDGKQLVAYSHMEMKLSIWNIQSFIFGILGNTMKLGVSFHLKQPRVLTSTQAYKSRIVWNNPNSFRLIFFDEQELSFTL